MTPTAIPADLLAIEAETLLGADYGGFEIQGDKLMWVARWVWDAPGDDPHETTWEAILAAKEVVAKAGYELGESWNDHDTAYFEVLPKVNI